MSWVVGAARGGHAGGGVAAGGATHLGFSAQPSNVTVNDVISPAVQVSALRGDGSTDTSYSGTITVARGTGSSHLSGTLNQTAINGVASFNDLALDTVETGDTLTASAAGLTGATSSTFNVTSSGTSPWLVEDFSTYTSTANMLADPRGIYSTAEDVLTAQMALDQTVGYSAAGLTQSLRYTFPDRTGEGGSGNTGRCSDYTIGRNISLPSHVTELWMETVMKTDSFWKTLAPGGWGCTTAAAYKFDFGRTDVSRYQLVLGIFGETADYTFGYPGNEEPADWPMSGPPAFTPFDGNWHVYRWHMKNGSGTGINTFAVDGVTIRSQVGITTSNTYIYGIALGRNMNQGPAGSENIWWGSIKLYKTDPGWGI